MSSRGVRRAATLLALALGGVACGSQRGAEDTGTARARIGEGHWVASPEISFAPRLGFAGCGHPYAASSGDQAQLVWVAAGDVKTVRVAADLSTLDIPPLQLNVSGQGAVQAQVACNGTDCLVVWAGSQAFGRFVSDGVLGATLTLGDATGLMPQVVAVDGGFVATWYHSVGVNDYALDAATISPTGEVTKKILLASGAPESLLAYNGTELLLTNYLSTVGKATARRFDMALNPIDQADVELGPDRVVQLSSDGKGFALAFAAANGQLSLRTIGADLQLESDAQIPNASTSAVSLVRSPGGYVLYYHYGSSPSLFSAFRADSGKWSYTKLGVTLGYVNANSGDLGAAMMSKGGVLFTCDKETVQPPNGGSAYRTTTTGRLVGDPRSVSLLPSPRQNNPQLRSTKTGYLAAWEELSEWCCGGQALGTGIGLDGQTLAPTPIIYYEQSTSTLRDAAITEDAVFLSGFHAAPFTPAVGFVNSLVVRLPAGSQTAFDMPGDTTLLSGTHSVLALSFVSSSSYDNPSPNSLSAQRFSLAGEPIDPSPVTLCTEVSYSDPCWRPRFTASAGGDFLLAWTNRTVYDKLLLLGADGSSKPLPVPTLPAPTSGSQEGLLANDSSYLYFFLDDSALQLVPISSAGEAGEPNTIPLPAGYDLKTIFGEGDRFRVTLNAADHTGTVTGLLGLGEITDIEALPELADISAAVSAAPGSFAAIFPTPTGFYVRVLARALGDGEGCEASWQCAGANCESGQCAGADNVGGASAGGAGAGRDNSSGAPTQGTPAGAGDEEANAAGASSDGTTGGVSEVGSDGGQTGTAPPAAGAGAGDSSAPKPSSGSGCACRAAGAPARGVVAPSALLLLALCRRRRSGGRGAVIVLQATAQITPVALVSSALPGRRAL